MSALRNQIKEDDRIEKCALLEAQDMYKQHMELENKYGIIVPLPRVCIIMEYPPFVSAFRDNYKEFRNNKYKEMINN